MIAKKPKSKKIGKHYLRIIGKEQLYFKGQTLVNFTPLKKTKLIKNISILPTFNHDKRHYTYAFQLPSSENDKLEQMEIEHDKRVAESLLQITEIFFPKPRSKHKYCGVCRGHYEDYKDHIESVVHISNLQKSPYQTMINIVCKQFQAPLEKKDSEETNVIDLTCECEENNEKGLEDGCDFVRACLEV